MSELFFMSLINIAINNKSSYVSTQKDCLYTLCILNVLKFTIKVELLTFSRYLWPKKVPKLSRVVIFLYTTNVMKVRDSCTLRVPYT